MNPEKTTPEFTTQKDKGSFWVNGKHNCLGRFTPNCWEIFRAINAPTEVVGPTGTLEVSMKPTDEKSWKNFVTQMKSFHNVDLSAEEYPAK
jgi:hypothetical protein